MSQATEQIASQYANASVNRVTWGDIIINVKVYGAKGDGSTNDAAAIQSALDAAPAGGVLILPDGEYIIRSTLQINKAITIIGSGQYTTFITAIGCSAIQVNKVDNVSIQSLVIAAASRYTTTPNNYIGIYIDGDTSNRPENHIYRDIYVDGFKYAVESHYLWSSVFDNFKCNFGHVGLRVAGLSVNNTVHGNSAIGVDGTSGSRGIQFVGDVPNEGWMIAETLIDSAEIAIQGVAMTHVFITNCILDHCGVNAILILDNGGGNFGGNWDISGCYIAMNGSAGDAAIKSSNSVADSQNRGNRIRGNDIITYTGKTCNYGVWMQGAQAVNNVITDNNIKGFTAHDILSDNGTNNVVGNVCLSAITNNIRAKGNVANNIGTIYYFRTGTFSTIGLIKITYDEAVPTTGSYNAGDICWKVNPSVSGSGGSQYVVHGWRRLTTGSNHVLNTDWVEMRMLTGT